MGLSASIEAACRFFPFYKEDQGGLSNPSLPVAPGTIVGFWLEVKPSIE
jgi:hypothetical protein